MKRFILLLSTLFLIEVVNTGISHTEEKLPAPDFTLMTLDSKKVALKDLKGKYVFLNFWATWCGPCKEEMPSMERLYQRLKSKKNFTMLAVSIDKGGSKAVKRFMEEHKFTFTVLLDEDSGAAAEYGVMGIPSTYLIDPQGFIMNRAVGAREWDSEESIKYFEKTLEGK
ncbi:MAG: TlpA family protein disulfide reductase [Nitrospinae bacterium]|nr:TlpA family protein disulfide reductase [Nitrospinota bacterium]